MHRHRPVSTSPPPVSGTSQRPLQASSQFASMPHSLARTPRSGSAAGATSTPALTVGDPRGGRGVGGSAGGLGPLQSSSELDESRERESRMYESSSYSGMLSDSSLSGNESSRDRNPIHSG